MTTPQIEIHPLRPAVRSDATTTLEVLIRILPPPRPAAPRPALNLGIVLDRSGSMAEGAKMDHARQAAIFAVEQLLPSDRVSVTIFDEVVETIVPNAPAADKRAIIGQLQAIAPRGSTALHGGWSAGAEQVLTYRLAAGLNRVLLLSDGLANVGVCAPEAIAADVARMQQQGVSTTTLGVGDAYNEDLLEAMAKAGDGNYYYVEKPVQLADIFQTELQGLMATMGRDVRIALEPRHGVALADLLNDFDRHPDGQYAAPNLVVGMPLDLVVILRVPPCANVTELLRVRASWTAAGQAEREQALKLLILPAVPGWEWEALAESPLVREQLALLTAARWKLRASAAMARHDLAGTQEALACCRAAVMSAPASAATAEEFDLIEQLERDLAMGASAKLMKRAKYQQHGRTRGRPQPGSS